MFECVLIRSGICKCCPNVGNGTYHWIRETNLNEIPIVIILPSHFFIQCGNGSANKLSLIFHIIFFFNLEPFSVPSCFNYNWYISRICTKPIIQIMLTVEVQFVWNCLVWRHCVEQPPVFHLHSNGRKEKIALIMLTGTIALTIIEFHIPFSICTSTVVDVELMIEHE